MPFRSNMLLKVVLACYLLLGGISDAAATSCMGYSQRYFILCDVNGCKAAFSVLEVPAFGACSRRPVVEEVDQQVSMYLGKLVTEVHASGARGLYLLKLSSRYWQAPNPNKFDRLMDELQESLPLTSEYEQCKPREMSISEVGGLLGKHDAKGTLELVTNQVSPQAIEAKRSAFETQEKYEYLKSILLSLTYWGSSILALLTFIHSVHLFFSRLYDKLRKGTSVLVLPVATQLVILAIGVGAIVMYPIGFWPGSVLVPVAVVILLCEGWAKFRISDSSGISVR